MFIIVFQFVGRFKMFQNKKLKEKRKTFRNLDNGYLPLERREFQGVNGKFQGCQ